MAKKNSDTFTLQTQSEAVQPATTNALANIDFDADLDLITITGPDGLPIILRPLGDDEDASDTYEGGPRIPRLAVTQDSEDERFPGYPGGTLFLTTSVYALDEETGKGTKAKNTRLIGNGLEALALGYRENRSYFAERYSGANSDPKPTCASSDAKRPDPQYVEAGTAPCPLCIGRNDKNRVVPICPMASSHTDANGKWVPPTCTFSYQIGFAVKLDGQWLVFDAYFRRISETAGRQLKNALKILASRGLPAYSHPVKLGNIKSQTGKGRALIGVMQDTAIDSEDYSDEDLMELERLAAQWNEIQNNNKARAKQVHLELGAGNKPAQLGTGTAYQLAQQAADSSDEEVLI